MMLGTTKIFKWTLKEDQQMRVISEQQFAVARDFLASYRKGLTAIEFKRKSEKPF